MGRRVDVIILIQGAIFILEFKVGEKNYLSTAMEQVWDYALDLNNFHETSQGCFIAPILVATEAPDVAILPSTSAKVDNLLFPIRCNKKTLKEAIDLILDFSTTGNINLDNWEQGRYSPTPTIIEAAMALYNGHSVEEIAKKDATAVNLSITSDSIDEIILYSKKTSCKSICFVTGVPGAGKTLVGLKTATKHYEKNKESASVFLSGNAPLVSILREALTRDRVRKIKEQGEKITKGEVFSQVKLFIQNVHHFRDDCLRIGDEAPLEHVAIFDEAQRAWDLEQTSNFMKRKKGLSGFSSSEPEFLISCLDRHKDWAVIICLVGGGQEINTGEAGIGEWIESINRSYPKWRVFISDRLDDDEYASGRALEILQTHKYVQKKHELHLSVSLRSFRAENLSLLIKSILDLKATDAKLYYESLKKNYPLVVTRDIRIAKEWLKAMARGTERYGIVVSSQAQRLKPYAIDVKSPMNPVNWFLDGKEDVRSSYYLEDVATEFQIQGLELDWTCVVWDADFRLSKGSWQHFSFAGSKWKNIKKHERKQYLKNAYRVLLTRARQGMIIVVPNGDVSDPTRDSRFYDETFDYLISLGIEYV